MLHRSVLKNGQILQKITVCVTFFQRSDSSNGVNNLDAACANLGPRGAG
jgi:hypothetical protein